jgi:hypothetical protein
MSLQNQKQKQKNSQKDPLRFPVARNRFCTMWISEGDDQYYFSLSLEIPFIGEENLSLSGTDKSQSLVNQIGETWKQQNQEAEGNGGDQ